MLPELQWRKRPFEIRNLLNPAFCAVLLHQSVKEYYGISKKAMPYPLVFLVLPIVFPSNIRHSLPERIDKDFDAWTKEKSLELLKFDEIVSFLAPYTKEAIIFAIQFGYLEIRNGALLPQKSLHPTKIWNNKSEAMNCYKQAGFVGRWFAHTGSSAIIFRTLGIHP